MAMNGRIPLRLRFCVDFAMIAAPWLCPAQAVAQHEQRAARLQALLQSLPHQKVQVSACVISLPDGSVVYQRDADQVLIPASNQKIIAAAAALEALGADYRFETRLSRRGDDLIITGGGDPALGDPKIAEDQGGRPLDVFMDWALRLRSAGVDVVKGDILIDDRAFENVWEHPGWEKNDLGKWYAAPVGALNFNDNCIEVTLWPTGPGEAAGYEIFPPNDWITIQNQCKTGAGKDPWIHRPATAPNYQLRGQCSQRASLQSVAVPDPGIFAGQVLKRVLKTQGIEVKGSVRRPNDSDNPLKTLLTENEAVIAAHHTPIAEVLKRALCDSQNLFAECLLKSVARHPPMRALMQPAVGSWPGGAQAVLEILRDWKIETTGMVISDGSGLSRENRVSAGQLARILHHVHLNPASRELFLNSLSVNGARGTMRKRLKDLPQQVWAKTGYLNGIRSMSGYVQGDDGEWFAFAVLFNNISGGTAPYNKLHDDICRVLVAGK